MEFFLRFIPEAAVVEEKVRCFVVVEHEGNCRCVDLREHRRNARKGRNVDDRLVHPLFREKLHTLLFVSQLTVREKPNCDFSLCAFFHEFFEVFCEEVDRVVLRISRSIV